MTQPIRNQGDPFADVDDDALDSAWRHAKAVATERRRQAKAFQRFKRWLVELFKG